MLAQEKLIFLFLLQQCLCIGILTVEWWNRSAKWLYSLTLQFIINQKLRYLSIVSILSLKVYVKNSLVLNITCKSSRLYLLPTYDSLLYSRQSMHIQISFCQLNWQSLEVMLVQSTFSWQKNEFLQNCNTE